MLAIEDEYGNNMPERIQSTKPQHVKAQRVEDYQPADDDTQQVSQFKEEIYEGAPADVTHDSLYTREKNSIDQNVLEGAMINIADNNQPEGELEKYMDRENDPEDELE